MKKKTNRLLSLVLTFVMLLGMLPTAAGAYFEEPTAEGNNALETTVDDYTKPVGVTMQRLTGSCVTETDNLGDDLLFVIKSGDRYYAMKDVAASEDAYEAVPAVDVTDWVNADGSLTVPTDTLDVAFWRYEQRPEQEYGMFINGRENYIAYSYGYESADGDDDYYNDAERNYWGKFKICTFEDGGYIESDPYYWSENGTSGTLKFNGSWSYYISSYNSLSLKYNVIADLRSDGNGGQEFYFRYLGTDVEYVGNEVEGYLYYADCRHQHTVRHAEYDAPTCMLKGCEEYWYCEGCDEYFKDEAMTQLWGESMPIIPAIGHDWGNETCANCDRPVPVYSKVTNQADFNALADDTLFILVSEYGGKYYAPDLGELYLYMLDSDGDGYRDIHDVDENGNDIPDYFEFDDGGETGVYDYLEWDMDGDGDVDADDHLAFSEMICDQYLTDRLYSSSGIGATEVTMNSDGTFSHEAVKATVEFEMVDLYLKEEIDDMIDSVKETEDWWTDDMRYTYECVKQFVIPNMFITAPSMAPVERQYQQRIAQYGDTYSWGVLFYNNASDYKVYNYETESIEQAKLNDVCTQDSIVVFDTFDNMWYDATWNRQLGQLRLRDYNGTITFVTGDDYNLEGGEYVDDENGGYWDTHDTQAAVYLYAANGTVFSDDEEHTCDWGDWVDDKNDRTHTRTCQDEACGKTETETHGWDNGVETKAPTCTELGETKYTCTVGTCGATKTETVDELGHDWSKWTDDGVDATTDTHTHTCQRNCGVAAESEPHSWGKWTPDGDANHKKTCADCSGERTDTHKWDDGVITTQPTEEAEGVRTYTCSECGHTKTEPVDKLVHEHSWSDWEPNNDGKTHSRSCRCNETETAGHNFDDGEVIQAPTHEAVGEIKYTCADCGYFYTEEIPATPDHEWTDWAPNDNETHTRSCRCNANETNPCKWDDGVVTAPTCEEEGTTVYTCTVCGNTKTETTPALDHDWGDWTDTGANAPADIHERSCKRDGCDAKETGNHEWSNWTSTGSAEHEKTCSVCSGERTATHAWDSGEVTKDASTKETGTKKYTCSDCGATKTEVIPKIVCDHTWGKWEAENDETHKHTCVNGNGCEAFQRQAHEWNNGVVTTEPTETSEGVMTYTCLTCSYEKTEAIAMLEHTHRFGGWTGDDGADTHTRECENGNTCTATETEPHSCDAWANNEDGTHSGKCSACGAGIVEAHTWGEWVVQNDGSLKRTCTAECGASEELPVLQPITDSVVTTTSDKNAASAELKDDAVVLFNSVLTNEEQTAVAAGNTTVSVYLEVEDIPVNEVSASDKAAAEAVIEEEDNDLDETTEIGMYLDINLFKEVTTTTEETSGSTTTTTTATEASQVIETSNKVTITIEIPDALINDDASVERIYRIIRVHEDENGNVITDVIEGIFDSVNKTFTFETDKFSTYALAYNDTEKAITTYTVTYTDGVDGVVVFADQTFTVEAGEATPTISNPTRSGYTFKGWNPSVAATVTGNVTYTATWQKNSSGGYIPSVPTFTPSVEETVGGDTTVDKKYPEQGDKVTITADPDKGYEVDEVIVTDRNGNKVEVIDNGDGTYSFKQPHGKVTITVTYVPEQVGFVDVEENTYYYDAVNWAVANGITNGTGDGTTFSPNAACTRAQMVTFLWRAAGCPEPAATDCKLTDVDMDSYYGNAVLWAIENGITNGTSATTFGPDAACTRAQMAAFLCRMAGGKAVSSTGVFADVKADAYYAEAVQWAVENGVTNGTGDNKFSPDAVCTRGQMVTFLYRYFVK